MKPYSLAVIALACAASASAQIGRLQDWNTFGSDTGRSGYEKNDPRMTKENVAKEFALLYKMKLEEVVKGQRAVTPPVIISTLISYRGFKELAYSGGSNNTVYAINADAGKMFWQKPLIYSSEFPQAKDPMQPCSGSNTAVVSLVPPPNFGGRGGGRGAAPPPPAAAAPGRGAAAPAAPAAPPPPPRGLGGAGFGASRPVLSLASDGRIHRLNSANGDDLGGPPVRFLPPNARASALNVADNVVYTSTNQGCGAVGNAIWAIDFAAETPTVTSFQTNGGGVWGAGGVALGPDQTVYAQLGDGPLNIAANKYSNTLVALAPRTLSVKQYFTPPELPAVPAKNAGMTSATPVVFAWKDRTLIASTGRDGRIYLLDAALVGGADHKTFLARTAALSDNATAERGIYGLASWDDETQTRWILAAVWGPSSGNLNGAVVAFKVEEQDGQPTLKQAWVSRDLAAPVPPVIGGGVVFALSAGDHSRTVKEGFNGIALVEEKPKPGARATLYGLDAATGKEIYSSKLLIPGAASLAGLTVANARVYFGGADSTFYCFGIPMER